MTPISNDLLLFKGTKDVSVAEDLMVLLLMELSRTVADRVAKLLPDPWNVVGKKFLSVVVDMVLLFLREL